jgi:hypothetical protein
MLTDRERSVSVIRPPYALSPPRSFTTPQRHLSDFILTASRHARTPGRTCTQPCDVLRLEKTATLQHSSTTPGYNLVLTAYDGMDGTFLRDDERISARISAPVALANTVFRGEHYGF